MERFEREILLAARLQHPHIVPLLFAGTVAPDADAMGAGCRFSACRSSGRIAPHRLGNSAAFVNETIHVLRDVASALAHAHGEGVVHRDIKPENVMLSGGVAVVTDFGVAKAVKLATTAGDTRRALTSVGLTLGTPAYMSPEQASADPEIDHRADIYSFGVRGRTRCCPREPLRQSTAPADAGGARHRDTAALVVASRESLRLAVR